MKKYIKILSLLLAVTLFSPVFPKAHAGGGPECQGFLCDVSGWLTNKLMSPIYSLLSLLGPGFSSPTNPWAATYGASSSAALRNPVVGFGIGLKEVGVPILETGAGIAADPAGIAVEEALKAAGVDEDTAAIITAIPTSPLDIGASGWGAFKRLVKSAKEATRASKTLYRYEDFEQLGKAMNRAKKSVVGPGLVTHSSADMTRRGGILEGRGGTYSEQIQSGKLYESAEEAVAKGEPVGKWFEMTQQDPRGGVRGMMHREGRRYQVTYEKRGWEFTTSMENPRLGVHSSRYNTPDDSSWDFEDGVGFLGPTRVDEAVVVDTVTGQQWRFAPELPGLPTR